MTPGKATAPAQEQAADQNSELGAFSCLLHALNQPLTGLQCSLELALSRQRTPAQYIDCLQAGLELTERMRNLAAALGELVEIQKEAFEPADTFNLQSLLLETVSELQPVAEASAVRLSLDCWFMAVSVAKRGLTSSLFRALESALSLAAPGSLLSIRASSEASSAWVRIGWSPRAKSSPREFPAAELGLWLAQAGLERAGVGWEREPSQSSDLIVLRLPLSATRADGQADLERAEPTSQIHH